MINKFADISKLIFSDKEVIIVAIAIDSGYVAMYYKGFSVDKKYTGVIQKFLSVGLNSCVLGPWMRIRDHQVLVKEARKVIHLTKEYEKANMYYEASLVLARDTSDTHDKTRKDLARELAEHYNIVANFSVERASGFTHWEGI